MAAICLCRGQIERAGTNIGRVEIAEPFAWR
jgi:hypothetical protein